MLLNREVAYLQKNVDMTLYYSGAPFKPKRRHTNCSEVKWHICIFLCEIGGGISGFFPFLGVKNG